MEQTQKTGRLYLHPGWPMLLCALACPVAAHEVLHEMTQAQAVVVRLVYADDEPFSYESYELYPDGSQRPAQTGRTDAQGRVVFLPDRTTHWRLRAFSADGHGVDLKLETPPGGGSAAATDAAPDRGARLLFGLAVILAAFGALQLFIRKKKPD
ncbi:MAG: hypothetical protein Q7U97_09800 [Rhodocyclaceae bacterium]|nr:hypothetical protein [Rhodocyclaceae bacterium]